MYVIITSKENITLNYIQYIYYLIYFQKVNNNVKILIIYKDKIHVITPTYTSKLCFQI